jgi:hypothetical protein
VTILDINDNAPVFMHACSTDLKVTAKNVAPNFSPQTYLGLLAIKVSYKVKSSTRVGEGV